jgi:hypothetical protein
MILRRRGGERQRLFVRASPLILRGRGWQRAAPSPRKAATSTPERDDPGQYRPGLRIGSASG